MEIVRFDKTEFAVINASHSGAYSLNEELGERASLLMEQGVLHTNPKSNWSNTGWKLTDYGKQYYDAFLEQVHANHGHIWMTHRETNPDLYEEGDEYGNSIDAFAYFVGYHNGMVCKKCGFGFCMHCKSEFEIEHCGK